MTHLSFQFTVDSVSILVLKKYLSYFLCFKYFVTLKCFRQQRMFKCEVDVH